MRGAHVAALTNRAVPRQIKAQVGVARKHQPAPKPSAGVENALTVQRDGRSVRDSGAHDRWCTMRDEFASNSFLAMAVAGLVLLCSGLVALAIT
jgi:hypothetical protein